MGSDAKPIRSYGTSPDVKTIEKGDGRCCNASNVYEREGDI